MTAGTDPCILTGGLAVDDRGLVSFVNGFGFEGVKRFYAVANHSPGFVRAWHGHRHEAKYVYVSQGSALVCAVKVDDWNAPSPDLPVFRYVLSAAKPSVLFIPPGYANGFMSLTADAQLLFFSTLTVEESQDDDIRFDSRFWNPWEIIER